MTILRSTHYEDIYFSVQDGLAEKRHVFLQGNQLPGRWADRPDFVICEAGFGTGLNFLITLQSFLATTRADQRLHFISFEKHPLYPTDIRAALGGWRDQIGPETDGLLSQYHMIVPGVHRLVFNDRIFLTLLIGDMNDVLPEIEASVDAWYLDGFNPAKNPDMWTSTLFDAMKKMSAQGATAATYSAARVVKEGLARAGFSAIKQPGFGYKSDMLAAQLSSAGRPQCVTKRGQKIAIYGAGIAGTSTARLLAQQGHDVDVIAPHGIADAASGNPRGLYNPRLSKTFSPLSLGHASGFAALYRFARRNAEQIGYAESGALHLIRDEDMRARVCGMLETWGWGDAARIVDAEEASAIAGITIHHEALWLPVAGALSPAQACHVNREGINVRSEAHPNKTYDATVLACGAALKIAPETAHLPLQTVRGQISVMAMTPASQNLKTNLCYGGYLGAPVNGHHVLGSTFQHWLSETHIRDEDHHYVIDRLTENIGPLFDVKDVQGGRASLRVTTPDRAPVIGRLDDGCTYVSTAHGSHGMVTGMLAAQMLADQISGFPGVFPRALYKAVDPARFSGQRKG